MEFPQVLASTSKAELASSMGVLEEGGGGGTGLLIKGGGGETGLLIKGGGGMIRLPGLVTINKLWNLGREIKRNGGIAEWTLY